MFIPHVSQAQGDRHLVWRSLHTAHFDIHYHEPVGLLARHLAGRAAQRVQVVLSAGTDAANGSASVVPYNVIRLNAVAPRERSVLSDYHDWLDLRTLLGRFYTPQGSLPAWFIEGLATIEESMHTTGGRSHETQFRMYLRMAALSGRVLALDWIGHDGEPWPDGDVRYLYGSAFIACVMQRHGRAAISTGSSAPVSA